MLLDVVIVLVVVSSLDVNPILRFCSVNPLTISTSVTFAVLKNSSSLVALIWNKLPNLEL